MPETHPLLSLDWISAYKQLWNANTAAIEGTRGLGALVEMGVRRAVTGPIKFQGSLLTALKYFSGLEAALLQFGDVPTTEWDASG